MTTTYITRIQASKPADWTKLQIALQDLKTILPPPAGLRNIVQKNGVVVQCLSPAYGALCEIRKPRVMLEKHYDLASAPSCDLAYETSRFHERLLFYIRNLATHGYLDHIDFYDSCWACNHPQVVAIGGDHLVFTAWRHDGSLRPSVSLAAPLREAIAGLFPDTQLTFHITDEH